MDISAALGLAAELKRGVFVTVRRNGRPQLSNVLLWVPGDGSVRVSIGTDRAKYHNLRREPWGAVHVTRPEFWGWAVLEGPVELSAVATAPDDAAVEELVAYYRASAGEHEDWEAYRAAMVAEHRLIARLRPEHAYGSLGG